LIGKFIYRKLTDLNTESKTQYIICQPMLPQSIPSTKECPRDSSNDLWPCKLNLHSWTRKV